MTGARSLPADRANDVSYSLRRHYVDDFYERNIERIRPGSSVLDLGGNRIAKRGQFDIERRGLRVIYANITSSKGPDVQADAARLPFADASLDAIICAELLEHVPDPITILRECGRVLNVGGAFLATVPFMYQQHGDPEDYGRYTDSFWRLWLSKHGFHVENIERQGGYWSVCVDAVRYLASDGLARRSLGARLTRTAITIALPRLKAFAVRRDERDRSQRSLAAFTTGFGIVALKRE